MTGAGALRLQFCGSQMAGLEMTQLHDKKQNVTAEIGGRSLATEAQKKCAAKQLRSKTTN
jgi:hypothetical protein